MAQQCTSIDGLMLKKMMTSGYRCLDLRKKEVDALNIFPVPDGDTGINMSLTIGSADKYAQRVIGDSITDVASAAATGSLFGARGNSGVILSQIMRGVAKGLENLDRANGEHVAKALRVGVESAYKAVMRPVEGTILTVSNELAKGALAKAKSGEKDVIKILKAGYASGHVALKKTPDLLPALKQAGVVDAGGFGLMLIIEGWIACLEDRPVGETDEAKEVLAKGTVGISEIGEPGELSAGIMEIADLDYPYCTEFLVQGKSLNIERMREGLKDRGDSLLVVGTQEVVKIHVHSANPGGVLEYAIQFGSLHEVKIHNMLSQNEAVMHAKKQEGAARSSGNKAGDANNASQAAVGAGAYVQEPAAMKKYGMAAVAVGEGIDQIFLSLGADQVVSGGQTMNPSASDIVDAVKRIRAENVFVFPNNGNIIMAARQANDLVDDQRIIVIPSRSIPQGIAAMLEFDLTRDIEQNEMAMSKALTKVGSGEVTYAVRDWESDGMIIKSGDVLGLVEGEIVSRGDHVVEVAQQVLEGLKWREKSLVTLFYGEETRQTDIDGLDEWLNAESDSVETEVYEGKQPLYYFIIGVE